MFTGRFFEAFFSDFVCYSFGTLPVTRFSIVIKRPRGGYIDFSDVSLLPKANKKRSA